jgi:RNA polymerase sigma-70 factor (ECF subfamily)
MWPNQDETQILLHEAQQGNQDAVGQLMNRHRGSLERMVRCRMNRAVGRRFDASDVVQEALLVAGRRLADYLRNPCLPFHAWLRTLARERLVDAYRHQLAAKRDVGREQSQHPDAGSSLNPAAQVRDHELTPAAAMLRKEFAARFSEAIERLSDEAREIILMRHGEQLTNSQAAELLALSEPAAAMRHLRALRQLKAVLGETPSAWLE